MLKIEEIDRYKGCLVGLAVGDALGLPWEFKPIPKDTDLTKMTSLKRNGHTLEPGHWSDDTSMALCLADSLCKMRRFKPHDQMKRYLLWCVDGYLSSTGKAFGMGSLTRKSLGIYLRRGDAFSGPTKGSKIEGNGSIMRLAPIPMFFFNKPHRAINFSGESSRTTHGAVQCIHACRYMGSLIVGALRGVKKSKLLDDCYDVSGSYFSTFPLCKQIADIAYGGYKDKTESDLPASGYVVDTLEAALWAFFITDSFEEGLIAVVGLGGDTDTTGAVYGQIAGAYYGLPSIRSQWREAIIQLEMIENYAEQLYNTR